MREHRIDQSIRPDLIAQVLPEYFTTSYPNLIAFVKEYYEFMDSDGQFGSVIKDLVDIRDIESTKLEYIDHLFGEMALGIGQKFFTEPREVLRNFAKFFRVKGSLYSAEGFFRSFYNNNDAQILYPKNDLFLLGDSASFLGHESQKLLQDGGAYQILSVFIKSEISLGEYQDFYKRFVHPAGFFLSAEMLIENEDVTTRVDAFEPEKYVDPDLNMDSGIHISRISGEIIPCVTVSDYQSGIQLAVGNSNVDDFIYGDWQDKRHFDSDWLYSDYDSNETLRLDNYDFIEFGGYTDLKNVDASTPMGKMKSTYVDSAGITDSFGFGGTWAAGDSTTDASIFSWAFDSDTTLNIASGNVRNSNANSGNSPGTQTALSTAVYPTPAIKAGTRVSTISGTSRQGFYFNIEDAIIEAGSQLPTPIQVADITDVNLSILAVNHRGLFPLSASNGAIFQIRDRNWNGTYNGNLLSGFGGTVSIPSGFASGQAFYNALALNGGSSNAQQSNTPPGFWTNVNANLNDAPAGVSFGGKSIILNHNFGGSIGIKKSVRGSFEFPNGHNAIGGRDGLPSGIIAEIALVIQHVGIPDHFTGAYRLRSILEFVECDGINSSEPVHDMQQTLISDLDHIIIDDKKDALI